MNVNLWGPSMWVLLQNVAFRLDQKHESCVAIYKSLEILLPCIHCRNSYTEFYKEYSDPAVGQYALWVYRMHSRVNSKLNRQQIDKALDMVSSIWIRGALRTFLDKTQTILFKEPSFDVVQKRFEMNYEEPVTRKDLMVVLLALATHYDPDLHKDALLKWLDCIFSVVPMQEIQIVQNAIQRDANLLETVIQLKYGVLDETSRYAASLIVAGSCLKHTCT
jgi:hypothetical protein